MERRLAAILAADVVGYSRLMERDEAGTLAVLKSWHADILQPVVSKHRGRIVKLMGDGVLVEFASAVNAVTCAVELQAAMDSANAGAAEGPRIVLRVGINLGDVMVEGSDLYGDGVNIAARLEGLSEPGGLCISGSVFEHVNGKLPHSFVSLGLQTLKNIDRPIHIYRLAGKDGPWPAVSGVELPLPDKPSIVVLPFVNMSADAEQSYFVDGLTEDLITDLSKVPELFVIARNSSFAYKGRSIDVRQIARELGVKNVLEGSARRAGGRVRINVQLIDAAAGGHIWADRFDKDLADIFAVQDEVTGKIVEALVGKLTATSLRERYRPASLEAYDLCVRGRAQWVHSMEDGTQARPLFERAIELDPKYGEAYRLLAAGHCMSWLHLGGPMHPFRELAVKLARKAVELDPGDSGAHWMLAFIILYERLWEESAREFEISLSLNLNDADAWTNLADLKVMEGRGAEAVACVEKALRLNPHPWGSYYWDLGQAQYAAGQYEAAVKSLRHEATYRTGSRRFLAAALAQLGLLEEAREEARLYLARNPHFRISFWVETQPFRDLATQARFVEGYRKAGLPE
jgi:TolB-like protein/class 3 adenylate cyclase/tetratricopeptide (TPR) repeat protein